MAKQLNNVQRAQQYLKKIFRLLNEQIFDGELDDVQVVLSNSSRCYGYYTLNSATWTGQANGEQFAQHEVGISSQWISRPITDVVSTICHECCHHYSYLKGIQDVSRSGYWHNKRFKEVAEQHGLIVEKHPKVGYGVTSCGERLLQFCIDNDLQEFQLNRSSDYFVAVGGSSSPSAGGSAVTTTRRSSSYKLLCPSCGCTVRATKLGVQLMCISCSEEMGRLITTILAAVAEMELENIHEQTFLGRQQKAREGKWNGGFSPYGYRISDGKTSEPDILVVEEEEAKIVRLIYDYYTKDKLAIAGIVTECDRLGIRKIPRKNSTLTRMNRKFVSDVLCNPVYCGKIAYGRRHLEKPDKTGKRKMVKPKDYILVDGRHEAIISYEQFQEAQKIREARAPMCVKRSDNEHAHLLATLIKCPVCGGKLYGNTTRKKKPNGEVYKDYHFYACKHRLKVNGQTCSFRTNINERDIDEPVVAIISKLINDPHLAELLSSKLDNSTDKKTVEEAIQTQKRLLDTVEANISRLNNQLDHMDYSSPIAERKAADMETRLNNLYNEVIQHEQYLDELYQRLYAINQNLLTKDAVLNILKQFTKLYDVMTPSDRQILIRTIVDEIQIYPEKQADGRIIKSIKLAIPIIYENGETPKISWDKNTTVESIVCLTRD